MSMIEFKRMQASVDAMNERIKALEATIEELKTLAPPVEETAKNLEDKFNAMTADLEGKINASVKATVDATMDVTKTELKAFAKSLVPAGRKKGSEEPAQE